MPSTAEVPVVENGVEATNGAKPKLIAAEAPPAVLHVIDSRTGQYHAIPIRQNAINASDLKKVKAPKDENHPAYQNEQGIRVFDPGFTNTVVSQSKITYM
jgi:citrate synthase